MTKNYSMDGEHVQRKACLLKYFCLELDPINIYLLKSGYSIIT